jgi:hypothetical protein
MPADLDIITKTYDLIQWTLNHTAKFSRAHRFSLGTRIEGRLYDLLDDLIEAKFTRDKAEILRRAALRTEQIRYQFRLAKDLHLLPLKSHHHALSLLEEIGRQLGAWRRKIQSRDETGDPDRGLAPLRSQAAQDWESR